MKYQQKPRVVEALQFTGDNWGPLFTFCGFHPHPSGLTGMSMQSFTVIGTHLKTQDPVILAEIWSNRSVWAPVRQYDWVVKDGRSLYALNNAEFWERFGYAHEVKWLEETAPEEIRADPLEKKYWQKYEDIGTMEEKPWRREYENKVEDPDA